MFGKCEEASERALAQVLRSAFVSHEAIVEREGAGNYRICDFGWCFGGDCHSCNYRVQAKDPAALGCDIERHQRPIGIRFGCCLGQSTVEYALVLAGFLALLMGLSSIWHVLDGGVLVTHALASASHHVVGVFEGVLADAFLV